jgi:uncharacterized membrane protein
MTDRNKPFVAPIAMIATATGARCMTGIAAVAHARAENPHALSTSRFGEHVERDIAKIASVFALGELVGDKLTKANRTDRVALAGRVFAGAAVGAAVANITGRDRRSAAIGGAVAAFVGAHLSFQFRKALTRHMPPVLAGLVEDIAVLGLAAAGTTLLGPRRAPAMAYSGKGSAAGARRQIAKARILTESTEFSQGERAPS